MSCTSQRQLHIHFHQPNFMNFLLLQVGTPVKSHIKNSSIITEYIFIFLKRKNYHFAIVGTYNNIIVTMNIISHTPIPATTIVRRRGASDTLV